MNLMESYKGRLSISEKYYAQQNNGARMSTQKKMITAMCLDNTARFINEAFANSVGTQRSDLGKFKTFCLDLTTLTMPNLIVNEIFLVKPMASFSGYVTFMEYALGTEKGGAGGLAEDSPFHNAMSVYGGDEWNAHDIVNSPLRGYGPMTADRSRYTGQAVVEIVTADSEGNKKLSWAPVKEAVNMDVLDSEGNPTPVTVDAFGVITAGADAGQKVRYIYDNQYIPQEKLPTLVGRMKGIALTAKARRIAVYYSQIAAFQAKQDYGMDFEAQIAQQAQAELSYEIDGEAVLLVKDAAAKLAPEAVVSWVDEELDTISYAQKAEGFARKLEQAKAIVYKRTGKFMPNWMLVGPEVMPILAFVKGFQAANGAVANGPYVAGTVAGMKVIVSPMLGKECILGILGADGKTAVVLYAPYMPIVPTQLLGFADGTMSQGFSTLYDMVILNPDLIGRIDITEGDDQFLGKVAIVSGSEI
jgi:hypothetical protein